MPIKRRTPKPRRNLDLPRTAYLMLTDSWDPHDPELNDEDRFGEFRFEHNAGVPSDELIALWEIHAEAIRAELGDPDFVPAIIRGEP